MNDGEAHHDEAQINDEAHETGNKNSQIKTSMLNSRLCDYSDVYILVSGTMTIAGAAADDNTKRLVEINKGAIFKNYAPFTDGISEINNTQIDNTKHLDLVIPMYNLIEYSDNYLQTPGLLWQYYKDDPNDNIVHSESFKFKINRAEKAPPAEGNTKDFKIAAPFKYLSNFWVLSNN